MISGRQNAITYANKLGRHCYARTRSSAVAWLYNEISALGWYTLKYRPKEERELAHLYERRGFPFPGDAEAMEEFIAKGGMVGTTIRLKGIVEIDKDSFNYQKEMQNKKFEREAMKLWLRTRNDVILELQEKGKMLTE